MSIALFFLLALIATGFIVYPLLPGRTPKEPASSLTDGDIDRAVADLRRSRSGGGLSCPSCGKAYQAGDRFCVRCGQALAKSQDTVSGTVCPSCGATVQKGDQFCAKCGHRAVSGEAA
jgi:predicted amidophosphoribosyltransferase